MVALVEGHEEPGKLMKNTTKEIEHHELDELFEKYRQAPDSYVFVVLADACRKIGRLDEALEICQKGVEKHPNYASGHVVLGKCLHDLGRDVEAHDSFKDVLALDANNLVALKYLGKMEATAGRYDRAREYLQSILNLDPENTEIKKTLQDVDEQEQISRGTPSPPEYENPPERVEDHVMIDTDTPSDLVETSDELATMTLADIFATQGYRSKAVRIYRELLKKQPNNALIAEKLRELGVESPVDKGGEPERTTRSATPSPPPVDDAPPAPQVEPEPPMETAPKAETAPPMEAAPQVEPEPPMETAPEAPPVVETHGPVPLARSSTVEPNAEGMAPREHVPEHESTMDDVSVDTDPTPVIELGMDPDAAREPAEDPMERRPSEPKVTVAEESPMSATPPSPPTDVADTTAEAPEQAEAPSTHKTENAQPASASVTERAEAVQGEAQSSDSDDDTPWQKGKRDDRRKIDEGESLNHFRRWLNRMNR
jgi:tetratricopeptide (TPR) repeat protein